MSFFGKLRHWFTPHHTNNFRAAVLHNSGIFAIIGIIVAGSIFHLVLDNPYFFFYRHVQAAGNTYYVATTGSDANSGSSTAPWRTLNKANVNLQAGDTLIIQAGTYTDTLNPQYSGVAGSPITYQGQDGATIRGPVNGIALNGKSYITIKNLDIRDVTSRWANIENSHHITIEDGSFDNSVPSTSVGYQGLFVLSSNNVILRNNTFGHWGTDANGAEWGDMVRFTLSDHILVDGMQACPSYAGHSLVASDRTSYIILRNSCLRNLWQKVVDLKGSQTGGEYPRFLLENNQILDAVYNSTAGKGGVDIQTSGNHSIYRYNIFAGAQQTGVGDGIFNIDSTTSLTGFYNNRWYNNTYYNNNPRAAHDFTNYQVVSPNTSDNWVVNSIFMDNGSIRNQQIIFENVNVNNNYVAGNLFYRSNGNPNYIFANGTNNTITQLQSSQPTNFYKNIEGNPAFVNASAYNFALNSNSPAIDKGISLTKTTNTGVNSTSLAVTDSMYFSDGWGLVSSDWIKIGNSEPVQISSISGNTINLAAARSWAAGDPVNLYKDSSGKIVFAGNAPDIGAFEYGVGSTTTPSPTPKPWTTQEADYSTWLSHYLQSGASFTTGDFSENGVVDGIDYILWVNHYGI